MFTFHDELTFNEELDLQIKFRNVPEVLSLVSMLKEKEQAIDDERGVIENYESNLTDIKNISDEILNVIEKIQESLNGGELFAATKKADRESFQKWLEERLDDIRAENVCIYNKADRN